MPETPLIFVSACLAGINCRYDGGTNGCAPVMDLVRQGLALPFCPEVFGGLPTPRPACEILGDRVVQQDGTDRTEAFRRGAGEGLALARLAGCREAILKARSPSCGIKRVYDGTFSGTLIPGNGLLAQLLMEEGLNVRSEEEL